MTDIKLEIEKLLNYGRDKGLLGRWDIVPTRNKLLALLDLDKPAETDFNELDYEVPESPQDILDNILDYAAEEGLITKDTVTYRDLFDTKLMGQLMPRQSEVARRFWQTAEEETIEQATNDYYQLAQDSNYIRRDRIARNLHWFSDTEYGELEITINLSKPEKDPEAIAAAKEQETTDYPQCYLCLENVGYPGRLDHPARQNHRVVPITLEDEQWYLQYSPYVYYNEHCIVFYEEHTPMKINRHTFTCLLDFVDQIPHYFLGSNADLPLVGGSILDHDHFQGGRHTFPMERADIIEEFNHPDFPAVEMGIVDWPMSVVRLRSADKEKLLSLADLILTNWREYSDLERNIKAASTTEEGTIQHNTVTPVARKQGEEFELDLVLRNNRKSDEHPAGIFHPHENLHHIKKENIGIIEVMGLAVLPGRLKGELNTIEKYLTGDLDFDRAKVKQNDQLAKHITWIEELVTEYGTDLTEDKARSILESEVGGKFKQVLEHSGVFKQTPDGRTGFKKFLAELTD